MSGKAVDPMSPVRKGDMQAFRHGQRIGDLSALSLQLCYAAPERGAGVAITLSAEYTIAK